MSAPLPKNELERLRALSQEAILDTLPERNFDELARLAAFICGTPISLVSLVDESRQWFKARVGLDANQTPRDLAFCAYTILKPNEVTVVEDATKDARFVENALVTGDPNIRFYAGAPLVTDDGFALGSLCVIDRVPRKLTAEQLEALEILRNQVIRELDHRRSSKALIHSFEMLEKAKDNYRTLSETLDATVQERTKEIAEKTEVLKSLTTRLMAAQDEERRRLARELHDSAGQLLAATGMNLSLIAANTRSASVDVRKAVEDAGLLIQQLTREIRTMSYLLHPPLLDELGLPAALSAYVQGLAERSSMDVTVDLPDDFPRLANNLELVLFRVIQESLTNVHRHSGTKKATIRARVQSGDVILEVEDQGNGIPAKRLASIRAHGSGVGLQGMRERVGSVGGRMEIESQGTGTRVIFTLPFTPAQDSEPTTVASHDSSA